LQEITRLLEKHAVLARTQDVEGQPLHQSHVGLLS
jgi:hypothetical protein